MNFKKRIGLTTFAIIAILFSTTSFIQAQETSSKLRWYVGGKLGYAGLIVNDIENLTTGKAKNKYNDFLSSFAIGLNGGLQYSIMPKLNVRAELEYLYRTETSSKKNNQYRFSHPLTGALLNGSGNTDFDLETHTVLANIYLDYYVTNMVAVYVGAGVGMSILDVSIEAPSPDVDLFNFPEPEASKNQVGFAWQVGLGTRIHATKNIAVDVAARYVGLPEVSALGNSQLLRMKNGMTGSFEVLAGVAYVF